MLLNRDTGILVYFSVVTDNAARETLYKMKVFVYANLLCFCLQIQLCRVCLAKADHALF